ncbi:sensor histidine kinase [Novispirillum sp. DQ9]|uniref:sensor histidine kinase n=1 Tax=Novispirillum sp. DQ9 TaxID=3398612 RepID=UPI003C7E2FE2
MSLTVATTITLLAIAAVGLTLAAWARCRAAMARRRPSGDDADLRLVLDAVSSPVIVSHQVSGRVFVANAAARALFADKDGRLDTITPEEFYEDPARRATLLSRLAASGLVEDFPAALIGRAGERLDVRISARRLRFAGEDALCVVLRDVTAQSRAEASHRAVLESIDAGVALFDGGGRVTFANAAAGRLLGHAAESLSGARWADLVGAEAARPVVEALRGGGFTATAAAFKGALHGPGVTTWLRLTAGPVDTADAGRDRALCTLVDITEMKTAEEALADSSDALRAVFDSAPLPILVLRRRGGDILLANRPAQAAFAPAAVEDGHWLDAYMDRRERRALLVALRRDGALHGREVAVRPDGRTPHWMRVSASALSYFGVDAVMVAFSDASESRRLGKALAAAESDRLRGEADLRVLAAALDVDVSGPLRVVEGALSGLRQRLDAHAPAEVADTLARGLTATRLAEGRLTALAAYARIALRDGQMGMVDLADVLQDVRHALSLPIAREGAVLQAESHLPVLRADRAALATALEHLVDNALKYRHPDRAPVIRLSAERQATAQDGGVVVWHLRLADNGRGIPQRHCDRAFGLFQRLHPEGVAGVEGGSGTGIGIGLTLCRRVIHQHGGHIWLESVEGQGTTIHFTLPTTPADSLPLPYGREMTGA